MKDLKLLFFFVDLHAISSVARNPRPPSDLVSMFTAKLGFQLKATIAFVEARSRVDGELAGEVLAFYNRDLTGRSCVDHNYSTRSPW